MVKMTPFAGSILLAVAQATDYPPPAGSFAVSEGTYNLGGFQCGNQEPAVKIWYPTNLQDGPFPVATFGHGMGGQIITDLTSSVASLGIVVVAPATSGGKCDEHHWEDMLHALEGSKLKPSLHKALGHVDFTQAAIYGHSMGGYGALKGAAEALKEPSRYNLKVMLDSHGYIGDYESIASQITIPAMFTTGTEDHAERLKGAFDACPSKPKVLAMVQGAEHMEPLNNGRLNPFDAHFLGCHLKNLQSSCDKIYGNAADSLCKANTMTKCEVVKSGPSPAPSPVPTPTPTPTPSPTPSPIPGGEPSADCLKCWQTQCSASKQTNCAQCMKDSKDACIPTCKPSLFGQKMMDWFCNSEEVVVV